LVIDGKLENLYVLDAILPTCQIRKNTIKLIILKGHYVFVEGTAINRIATNHKYTTI
jgi:hypothetical protein